MKLLIISFLLCILGFDCNAKIDNRKYADWGAYPYNMFVLVNYSGTGQYVAPDLILTSLHLVDQMCYDSELDYINQRGCDLLDSLEREYKGDVVAVGRPYSIMSGKPFDGTGYLPSDDWALIRVRDPKFFRYDYFNVLPQAKTGNVNNAGFGAMRIVTDAELKIIRKKFIRLLRERYPVNNNDDVVLKKIPFTDFIRDLDDALGQDDEDGQAMEPLFQDGDKLKFSRCSIEDVENGYFYHRCMGAHGNSGGAFWSGDNDLHGILATGADSFDKKIMKQGSGVDSKSFYDALMQAMILSEDKELSTLDED